MRGAAQKPARPTRDAEPAQGIGAYLVLGVLALAVAALAGYVLTTNTVKQRQADLEASKQATAAANAKAAALRPYADFETLANARVETVRGLAAARFDWERALRDVSLAIADRREAPVAQRRHGPPGREQRLRWRSAPRLDLRAGHHDGGLRPDADRRRADDVPPPRGAGRHPRRALEVREAGAGRDDRLRDRPVREGHAAELLRGRVLRALRRAGRPRAGSRRAPPRRCPCRTPSTRPRPPRAAPAARSSRRTARRTRARRPRPTRPRPPRPPRPPHGSTP